MTSFNAVRECVASLPSNPKRRRPTRHVEIDAILLIINVAAFQFVAGDAWALPSVVDNGHFTDRFGPNSLPWPNSLPDNFSGDVVQVYAVVQSSDPVGSPAISAQITQGTTTLSLDLYPPELLLSPISDDYNVFYKLIDFDPGLTGSWQITTTDSTGIGPSTLTNPIVEPQFLPLVEEITVHGTPLGARASWSLPNLDGFDVDVINVRILEAASGSDVWQSNLLPVQSTSIEPPTGVMQVGVEYVYMINLADLEDSRVENSSKAFSQPFHFTVPGDFNTDGTVDAADYIAWRKNFSGDQAMYDAWRANFGTSLGPGSGSALPSAAPLSAAVPEPATLALAALALVLLVLRRK